MSGLWRALGSRAALHNELFRPESPVVFCVSSSFEGREQVRGVGAREALAGPAEPWLRQQDAPRACGHRLVLACGVGAHTVTMSGGGAPSSESPSCVQPLSSSASEHTGAGGAGEAGGPGAGIPWPGTRHFLPPPCGAGRPPSPRSGRGGRRGHVGAFHPLVG